jgi:hypothetical protein
MFLKKMLNLENSQKWAFTRNTLARLVHPVIQPPRLRVLPSHPPSHPGFMYPEFEDEYSGGAEHKGR